MWSLDGPVQMGQLILGIAGGLISGMCQIREFGWTVSMEWCREYINKKKHLKYINYLEFPANQWWSTLRPVWNDENTSNNPLSCLFKSKSFLLYQSVTMMGGDGSVLQSPTRKRPPINGPDLLFFSNWPFLFWF